MNEAASVFLRADIKRKDGYHLASWMQNRSVIRYLNEERNISDIESACRSVHAMRIHLRGGYRTTEKALGRPG